MIKWYFKYFVFYIRTKTKLLSLFRLTTRFGKPWSMYSKGLQFGRSVKIPGPYCVHKHMWCSEQCCKVDSDHQGSEKRSGPEWQWLVNRQSLTLSPAFLRSLICYLLSSSLWLGFAVSGAPLSLSPSESPFQGPACGPRGRFFTLYADMTAFRTPSLGTLYLW